MACTIADLTVFLVSSVILTNGNLTSSEDRFKITYCPGSISKEEIESVNFSYADLEEMTKKYNPEELKDGFNTMPDGEEIFYISNPAIGLWAYKERFK